MSYLDGAKARSPVTSADFGFSFEKADSGWRWVTYDQLGQVAAQGIAPNKAMAAACVIRELART